MDEDDRNLKNKYMIFLFYIIRKYLLDQPRRRKSYLNES